MKKTYTYNPEKIGEQGVDRMRFELGDTMVEGAEETSALSNEEYTAIIAAKKTWKRAKLAALESIMRRFGMEVNTTVGPLKLEMQARAEFWRKQSVRAAEKRVWSRHGTNGRKSFSGIGRRRRPLFLWWYAR